MPDEPGTDPTQQTRWEREQERREWQREAKEAREAAAAAKQEAQPGEPAAPSRQETLGMSSPTLQNEIIKKLVTGLKISQPELLALTIAWELTNETPPALDPVKRLALPTFTKYELHSNTVWYIWPDGTYHGGPPTWKGYHGEIKALPSDRPH
jgi:hypothetical protein